MARLDGKDLVVWSVPAALALGALFFAWRAFWPQDVGAPSQPAEFAFVEACAPGRHRCRAKSVEVTTGERGDAGACTWRSVGSCVTACVSEQVALAGVDDATAKAQLCDPPRRPLLLLSKTESYLDAPLADAGVCEGDGYIPTSDGFLQCILRSSADRGASGIIFGRAFCRAGTVQTLDRAPRLVRREEAAAIWCRRDPLADVDEPVAPPETSLTDASLTDAGPTDASLTDARLTDAGPIEAGVADGGAPKAGPKDAP